MILTITLNPCIDLALFTDGFAPHDSNRVLRSELDAGGKGVNLSRMVVELGGETLATGCLGGMTGEHILAMLTAKGVACDFVTVRDETRTNVSIESGDGPPTVFNAPGAHVTGLEWEELIGLIGRHVKPGTWMALGGSLPPGVPAESYKLLGDMARSAGAKLLLDADKEALKHGLQAGPDFVKPNQDEAERLLDTQINSVEDAFRAAQGIRDLLIKLGSQEPTVVVSLGARGAVFLNSEVSLFGVPPRIQAKSTIGSGDSFLGGFLVGEQRGLNVHQCFALGIAAGAATAQSDGTRIGTRAEVDGALLGVVVHDQAQALELVDW